MDPVLWLGKGAVGRVGLWEGDAAKALITDAPEVASSGRPMGCADGSAPLEPPPPPF